MKKSALISAVLLCAGLLAGCANEKTDYTDRIPEEYREREVLEVTCFYSASYGGVKNVIEEFNASQEEYYALYLQFGEESAPSSGELMGGEELADVESDYDTLLDSFGRAILGGEVGDVVILPYNMDYAKYADKGIFADLYDCLDAETLDDVFGCVKDSLEYRGKLPVLLSDFRLRTITGKASAVERWNTEECLRLAQTTRVFNAMTRDSLLEILIYDSPEAFLNVENGACDFGETFVEILEFAETLPETVDNLVGSDYTPYVNDEILMHLTPLASFDQYISGQLRFGNEAITLYGYPTADGGKSYVEPVHSLYAISAESEQKDAAAAFLTTVLTTTGERISNGSFPSLKSEFLETMEETKQQYFFFYLNRDLFDVYIEPITAEEFGEPGFVMQLTDEIISELLDIIETADVFRYVPKTLTEIMEEEITAYLAGIRSAEETAALIESRVNLYFSERNE